VNSLGFSVMAIYWFLRHWKLPGLNYCLGQNFLLGVRTVNRVAVGIHSGDGKDLLAVGCVVNYLNAPRYNTEPFLSPARWLRVAIVCLPWLVLHPVALCHEVGFKPPYRYGS